MPTLKKKTSKPISGTESDGTESDIVDFLRAQLKAERDKYEKLALDLVKATQSVESLNQRLLHTRNEAEKSISNRETVILDALGFLLNGNTNDAVMALRSVLGPRELNHVYNRNSDFLAAKKRNEKLEEQNIRLANTIKQLSQKVIGDGK